MEGNDDSPCDSWHNWSNVTLARWLIYVTFAVRPILGMILLPNLAESIGRLFLRSLQPISSSL